MTSKYVETSTALARTFFWEIYLYDLDTQMVKKCDK